MRAAAQIVSYEIPSAMALLPAVLLSGTMSTQGIIAAQTGTADSSWLLVGGWPWNWNVFHSPMLLACFVVFFAAQLAEGARIPFDLPEGESELVSGYNTEYSGFRFGAFFTAEFANTWIAAALCVIVFLGGWQIPGVHPDAIRAATGAIGLLYELLSLLIFLVKMTLVVFLIIQLRWTIPRVRVDQMMAVCWKYMLPVSFVAVLGVLAWMIIWPWSSTGSLVWRLLFSAAGLCGLVLYGLKVRNVIRSAQEQPYLKWVI
jgi:NADH-quinone oxidoreductase subunit H